MYRIVATILIIFAYQSVTAQNSKSNNHTKEFARLDSLRKTLDYKTGSFIIGDNLATINVPDNFIFIDSKDSRTVLNKIWNNPENNDVIGMLMPAGISPLDDSCWAVVFTYSEDGHVNDKDAEMINPEKLLSKMQRQTDSSNSERIKNGLGKLKLTGWIKKPVYDKSSNKLYWGKKFLNVEDSVTTMSYKIQVLGRKGVLELVVVANYFQLEIVNDNINALLESVNFVVGNRYEDFSEKTDKIAPYTIAGLIAGGTLPKSGWLAKTGLFFVQQWKIITLALVFLIALFNVIIRTRKSLKQSL